MAKRINFFATRDDMIQLIDRITEELPFEMMIIGHDGQIYDRADEIPELGSLSKTHGEKSYLIMKKGDSIKHSDIQKDRVYQGDNPNSMEFDPSGISSDGTCLIHGLFTTMEDNEISNELLKTARRVLRRTFQSVRGWYIGPETVNLKGKVRFICIGVNEPEEYDLKL